MKTKIGKEKTSFTIPIQKEGSQSNSTLFGDELWENSEEEEEVKCDVLQTQQTYPDFSKTQGFQDLELNRFTPLERNQNYFNIELPVLKEV